MVSWELPPPAVTEAEALAEHARTAVPRTISANAPLELAAMAETMAVVLRIVAHYHRLSFITRAMGPWLAQHARGRGIYARADESTESLRERVRAPTDTVTPVAILEATQSRLASAGVDGEAALIEVPLHGHVLGFSALGYRRLAGPVSFFVIAAPVGTPESVRRVLEDDLRVHKMAGVGHVVEIQAEEPT